MLLYGVPLGSNVKNMKFLTFDPSGTPKRSIAMLLYGVPLGSKLRNMKWVSKDPRYLQTDNADFDLTCRAASELRVNFHMSKTGLILPGSFFTHYSMVVLLCSCIIIFIMLHLLCHCLFIISPFGASGSQCFLIEAFPG